MGNNKTIATALIGIAVGTGVFVLSNSMSRRRTSPLKKTMRNASRVLNKFMGEVGRML